MTPDLEPMSAAAIDPSPPVAMVQACTWPCVVLDTNIVMDMLHFANLHTAPLLAALAVGRYQCFTDEACLAELERVCTYPEFRLDPTAQAALLDRYRQLALRCDAAVLRS